MRFLCGVFTPIFFFGSVSSDLNIGLRALQQIRTLIPERLSEEEFAILIDREALTQWFKSSPAVLQKIRSPIPEIPCSHFYYTHWTISGEPIRILDRYQEFEYGPYWLYPTAIQHLCDLYQGIPSPCIQ